MNKYLSVTLAGLIGILLLSGCSANSTSTNNAVASNSLSQSQSNNSSSNVNTEGNTSSLTNTPANTVSNNISSDSSTGGSQYSNDTFGFTVNIPESWKNEYTISSISPQGGEALQSISFNYAIEKGQPFLLNLVVYPKDYLPHLTEDPQVLKAFSNDKYSFAFYKENEYPDPNDTNYSEFKDLESEIPWIVSHFVVKQSNPLSNSTQNSPLIVAYHQHGYSVLLKLVPPKSIGKEIYRLQKWDELIVGSGGTFPIGTKLFEIKGVPINQSIAVEINTNTYLQANIQGWFPPQSNSTS